jgi:hypothetical protein
MDQLPNMATGSAVSSTTPATARKQDGARTPASSGIPEDLLNEDLVFDSEESTELTELLDAYASLTAGVDQANILNSTGVSGLGGTQSMRGGEGFKPKVVQEDPFVLRPLFCRFLLASKICGDSTSVHPYHETLALFDKYATMLGAYMGLNRSVLILVIARMLRLKGDEGLEKRAQGQRFQTLTQHRYDSITGELLETTTRPAYIRHFFEMSMVFAMEHFDFRKTRSEEKERELCGVEDAPVPPNVLAEVSSGSLWPPLPPRSVKEPQLPEWMSGVRRWQEDLEQQNPGRLLAMRRYTETVLRGEILGSQLLEPEVLHFAARFRPLFTHMFSAYADWPTPPILLQVAESQGDAETQQLGHLSFTSFFRFCVDFGVFPNNASFEEIRQIYNDAETVLELPEPSPPPTPSAEDETQVTPPGTADQESEKGQRGRGKKPASAGKPGSADSKDILKKPGSPKKGSRQNTADRGAKGRQSSESENPAKKESVAERKYSEHKAEKEKREDMPRFSSKERPPSGDERPDSRRDMASRRNSVQAGPAAKNEKQDDEKAIKITTAMMRSKKAMAAAAVAEAAAKAAAEAAVPKADLFFMEKPLSSMNDLELRTIYFFAAIDGWLSVRFVRFADLWSELEDEKDLCRETRIDSPDSGHNGLENNGEECASPTYFNEKDFPIFLGDGDQPLDRDLPDEVRQLQEQILSQGQLPPPPPGQRRNSAAERNAKAAAAAAAEAAALAAMAVPPVVTIGAAKLLEVIAPMGMANRPTEEELEEMYMLLLQIPAQEQDQRSDTPRGSKKPLGIAVFQMDKILRTAKRNLEAARQSCCMLLRTDAELSAPEFTSRDVIWFLEDLSTLLLNRASFMGITGDFLADFPTEFPASKLLDKATELGMDIRSEDKDSIRVRGTEMHREHFCHMLVDNIAPASIGAHLRKHQVYRALSLVQEGRRCQRHVDLTSQLRCLAGDHERRRNSGPTTAFFGLAAFVECLLKLALHRLGGKGSNEIQRGSPAWWKCAWLIALLNGEFSGHLKRHSHEKKIQEYAQQGEANSDQLVRDRPQRPPSKEGGANRLAKARGNNRASICSTGGADEGDIRSMAAVSGKSDPLSPMRRNTASNVIRLDQAKLQRMSAQEKRAQEMETWYCRSYVDDCSRYVPPLENLVWNLPDLFDVGTGEAHVPGSNTSLWPVKCSQCNESPSPSGWGTPGCPSCSGVEDLCLPISNHLFSMLLRTPKPEGILHPSEAWKKKEQEAKSPK